MTGERYDVPAALRALASPMFVGALVVLALNDHVLKRAWPSVVTGKLSDVAGLVVAPVLLGLVLVLLRVPRAPMVAVVATGVGFAWVKATQLGADMASAAWTQLWGPSVVLRDPTDLLALPALGLALLVQRRALDVRGSVRARGAAAAGALVLPFAVLATAATSCDDPSDRSTAVGVVQGRWDGSRDLEPRLVWRSVTGLLVFTRDGSSRELTPSESSRLTGTGPTLSTQCDPDDGDHCWRLVSGDRPQVDATTDGGDTWRTEYLMPKDAYDAIFEELDEDGGCGGGPRIETDDIAVLGTAQGPLVAVAAAEAGLLLRDPAGHWTLSDRAELDPGRSGLPSPLPEELITPVEAQPGPRPSGESAPSEPASPTRPPQAACSTPSSRTVTPNPANGSPTTYPVCPS